VDIPKNHQPPPTGLHPCVHCGACCAYYRVSFESTEILPESFEVPASHVATVDAKMSVMRGTDRTINTRCTALIGEVGTNGKCSIYENRPSPCRKFEASYSYGVKEPRCDEARAAHHLPPLTLKDYDGVRNLSQAALI
jgi:Fe-S-cluster containining protein